MTKLNISINKLIEAYKKYKSIRKVGKKFGIHHEIVRQKLKNHGVLVNLGVGSPYACDHGFFSYDTPESFYWAGFIAADGCVHKAEKKYKTLTIGLSFKDIKHLYKFKKVIKFDGKFIHIFLHYKTKNIKKPL